MYVTLKDTTSGQIYEDSVTLDARTIDHVEFGVDRTESWLEDSIELNSTLAVNVKATSQGTEIPLDASSLVASTDGDHLHRREVASLTAGASR